MRISWQVLLSPRARGSSGVPGSKERRAWLVALVADRGCRPLKSVRAYGAWVRQRGRKRATEGRESQSGACCVLAPCASTVIRSIQVSRQARSGAGTYRAGRKQSGRLPKRAADRRGLRGFVPTGFPSIF